MKLRRDWLIAFGVSSAATLFAFACSQSGDGSVPVADDAALPSAPTPAECPVATVPDSGPSAAGPDGGGALGGKLMIVGGALNDSSPIWRRTIDEGGGRENVHFLVVTAAITNAVNNYFYYQDLLHRIYGVSLDNIKQAQIAIVDDPNSKFVDESAWKENGDSEAEVAKVRDWATVVWFGGGDQVRIAKTFLHSDGTDRKVTTAIRDKLAAGKLIVAGTSAGAAVCSDPMISEGDPYASSTHSPIYTPFYPDNWADAGSDGGVFNAANALVLNKGLGFLLPKYHVLIDTHWFQRARFPRTVRALDFASGAGGLDPKMKVGLGVGESAALLVDMADGTAEVVGDVDASLVGVVNVLEATTSGNANPYSGENVRLGYLNVRDRFVLPTDANPSGTFLPEASKHRYNPCNGSRRYVAPLQGDLFVPGGYVTALQDLIDARFDSQADGGASCHVDGFGSRLAPGSSSIGGAPFAVQGFFFRFTSDSKTRSFWSSSWGWEVENVLMRFGTGTGSYTPPF